MELMKQFRDLAKDVESLKVKLYDIDIDNRYLRKNMHMNAPKLHGAIEYDEGRVIGDPIADSLGTWTIKHVQLIFKKEAIEELIDGKVKLLNDVKEVLKNASSLEEKILYL